MSLDAPDLLEEKKIVSGVWKWGFSVSAMGVCVCVCSGLYRERAGVAAVDSI